MKQDIAALKKRVEAVSSRMVPLMGQVNYANRLLSHVKGLERIVDQLEREIAPLKKRGHTKTRKSERDRQRELDDAARMMADREVERDRSDE
jgi:hypothetical protein